MCPWWEGCPLRGATFLPGLPLVLWESNTGRGALAAAGGQGGLNQAQGGDATEGGLAPTIRREGAPCLTRGAPEGLAGWGVPGLATSGGVPWGCPWPALQGACVWGGSSSAHLGSGRAIFLLARAAGELLLFSMAIR